MLTQAFWTSLRILAFRAGPEDLPYDPGKRLSLACVAFGLLANAAVAALELSLAGSLLLSAAAVLAMGLFTRVALRARQFDNRCQQTFNALLITSSVLSLAIVAPARQLLPLMEDFAKKLQADPTLMNDPARMPQLPVWAMLLSMLILVLLAWQFAVTAFIYRRAANTQAGGGILIALLCVLTIMSFKALFSVFLG